MEQTHNPTQFQLTADEQAIMNGEKGELLQKVIKTVVSFGELFGATKLVDLQAAPHLAMSWSSDGILPFLKIYRKLADAGLKTYAPFTSNPKPMDHNNLDPGEEKKTMVVKIYNHDDELTDVYEQLGMVKNAWSCACFLPQIGNTPKKGDFISWSESSAINFANSYLGARTNRNSVGIDMMTAILGKAPYFELMTDEGRKADWLIECRLSKLPHPELLGAAVGLKVMEDIPYVTGLDCLINNLDDKVSYMKDFGAAAASNGAVGLYHVEGVTPEALDQGRDLLKADHQRYVIDDETLETLFNSYPVLWPDADAKPNRVFIGCPHNTLEQLIWWGQRLTSALEKHGQNAVTCPTYLFAHQSVADSFQDELPELFQKMTTAGIQVTQNCPVMYLATPLQADELIVTNSNKTRVYSKARFYMDDELVHIALTGELPDAAPANHRP